jgi:hypothetical protein
MLHLLALAPAWLAAAWIERRALGTFFTADDLVALARVTGIEKTPLNFRPLSAALAPRLEYAAFGLAPAGYHAVNLGLHLAATAGVYALASQLGAGRGTATAAAILFACSGIAFTPLHAASGIGDLLATVLLLAATLLHLRGRLRSRAAWLWAAAALASAAVLAKESAIAWPLAVLSYEGLFAPRPVSGKAILPAITMGLASALWLLAGQGGSRWVTSGAYALDFSLAHLVTNLTTYAQWCAALGTPIRDLVAAADPASRLAGLLVVIAFAALILIERPRPRHTIAMGAAWWLAFLIPVLPLAHHTYLYYLYLPWAGGAIAAAAASAALFGAIRRLDARTTASVAVAAFVVAEAFGISRRETRTLDSLPADRTLREAMLLGHALPALRDAGLAPATAVGFVNPVPRTAFALPRVATEPGAPEARHVEYVPLEAAFRGGRAIELFAPGVADSGFAAAIPPAWERVECFLYEQRGWLRRWGRGQQALMRQAELQAASGQWAAAESSFARVRAIADTVPAALCGQVVALGRLGRSGESKSLAEAFVRRWPGDARAGLLLAPPENGPVDPRLIRPFDSSLPAR